MCVRCVTVTVRKIFGRLYAQTREDLRNFKQKMPWNLDKSCVRMCKINLRNFNKCWNGLKHFSKTSNKFFLGINVSLACHWYMIKHMYRYIYLVCQWRQSSVACCLFLVSLAAPKAAGFSKARTRSRVQGEAYHLEAEMKDWMGLYRREHLLSTSASFSVLLTAKDGKLKPPTFDRAVCEVFLFDWFCCSDVGSIM